MSRLKSVLLAVAATSAFVAAAPIQNAAAADGYFYIWEHINQGGKQCRWYGTDADYRFNPAGTCVGGNQNQNANDIASSWLNNGYANAFPDVRVYEHIDRRGASVCVPRGQLWSNLVPSGWNDRASSHGWTDC